MALAQFAGKVAFNEFELAAGIAPAQIVVVFPELGPAQLPADGLQEFLHELDPSRPLVRRHALEAEAENVQRNIP